MKILQLCNKVSFPVRDGGTAAMNQLANQLYDAGNSVKIIAINTHKQNALESDFSAEYKMKFSPEIVFIDTRIKVLHAFLNLFSCKSYNVQRFNDLQLHLKLETVLKQEVFDCIVLESLFVMPYIKTIRKYSTAKIILRTHNVEHIIWQRFASNEKNLFKKIYLYFLSSRLKKYELQSIPLVDGVAAISTEDIKILKSFLNIPIEFTPFAYKISNEIDFTELKINQGYFIGAMDWLPNLEAGKWIVEELMPALSEQEINFNMCLSGIYMPQYFLNLKINNLLVVGKIDNTTNFIELFGILIAPIFSGGGVKIKIIEALANGKVVITTKVGAEGINYVDGKHLLIAETANEFVLAINKCVTDKKFAQEVAEAGFQLIKEEYQPAVVVDRLLKFILTIKK